MTASVYRSHLVCIDDCHGELEVVIVAYRCGMSSAPVADLLLMVHIWLLSGRCGAASHAAKVDKSGMVRCPVW
jgi:hypothetical protein